MGVENYQKRIIDLRAEVAREREAKSKDNERYARSISNASNPSSKASFQKLKIDAAARHDRRIEQLKKQIAQTQETIRRMR